MKLRSTRGEYWLAVSDSATIVTENTTPATVIIEVAMAESMPRAPSAPAPNSRGQSSASCRPTMGSSSMSKSATATPAITISPGTNQRLPSRSSQSDRSRFMRTPSMQRALRAQRSMRLPRPCNGGARTVVRSSVVEPSPMPAASSPASTSRLIASLTWRMP